MYTYINERELHPICSILKESSLEMWLPCAYVNKSVVVDKLRGEWE